MVHNLRIWPDFLEGWWHWGGGGPLRFPRIYELRPFFVPIIGRLSDLNISPPEVRSDDADENADVSDRTTLGGRLWSKSLSPYDIKLCIAFGAGWLIVDRIDGKISQKKSALVPFKLELRFWSKLYSIYKVADWWTCKEHHILHNCTNLLRIDTAKMRRKREMWQVARRRWKKHAKQEGFLDGT